MFEWLFDDVLGLDDNNTLGEKLFGGPERTNTQSSSSGSTEGGSTSRAEFDPWVSSMAQNLGGMIPGAINNAGRFDSYLESLGMTPAYQGASRSYLEGSPFTISEAQPYMDMYRSAVQPALSEIDRTLEGNIGDLGDTFGNAYGGGKFQLARNNLVNDAARLKSNILADASIGGLNFGANRYDTNTANRFNAERAMQYGSNLASRQRGQAFNQLTGLGNAGIGRLGAGVNVLSGLPLNRTQMGTEWGTSTGNRTTNSTRSGGGGGLLGQGIGLFSNLAGTGILGSPSQAPTMFSPSGAEASGIFAMMGV